MSCADEYELCNRALDLLSGGKDTVAIASFTDTDTKKFTSNLCGRLYDPIRQEVLKRFQAQETLRYADLGADIKDTEVDISSIAVGGDPFPVTVTTDAVHEKSTGDHVYLKDVEGTGGIISLNGELYTITVVDTTSFTLDDVTGSADWSHTADTGVMSDAPECADYEYVFELPKNTSGTNICLLVVRQTDEQYHRMDYIKEVKQGFLFTNILSNEDGDSAYIEYVYDEKDTTKFSDELVYAMVVRLAAELAPRLMGAEHGMNTRRKLLEEYETLVLPTMQGINRSQQYQDEDERESKFSWLGDRNFEI